MLLDTWSSMKQNPLLPEDWGAPDSMRERSSRLDIIARSLGVLPFSYELQRTVGPYSDQLVFECATDSHAKRFCHEVSALPLEPLNARLWARSVFPHSADGRVQVKVDVLPTSITRLPSEVLEAFVCHRRTEGMKLAADVLNNRGGGHRTLLHPDNTPCFCGVDMLTGRPISVGFEARIGSPVVFIKGPRHEADGILDTILLGLALGSPPRTVHLVMGSCEDDDLSRFRELPQKVDIVSPREAVEMATLELDRRRRKLDTFYLDYASFNELDENDEIRPLIEGINDLFVLVLRDIDRLTRGAMPRLLEDLYRIMRFGPQCGVQTAAWGSTHSEAPQHGRDLVFCHDRRMHSPDEVNLPVEGLFRCNQRSLRGEGERLCAALQPMSENAFKSVVARFT